jgi:hypothetical protein
MPKTQEIIDNLQSVVSNYSAVAIFWHIAVYLLLGFLIVNWNPSNKLLGILICLPIVSVAILAWMAGNPFNGILFSIAAILIFIFGLKTSIEPISVSSFPFYLIGIFMILFGLVYPHFLETNSIVKYVYASPFGLAPCPTISVLIGFVLLYNGFGSNAISITFIVFGLFYGIFGIFKLRVYLDVGLLFGTLVLLIKYLLSLGKPMGIG